MEVLQLTKILILSVLSFLIAFGITPFISRILNRFQLKKQIRTSDATPIFSKLHEKKAGTPTMGGIIIWATVLGMALLFWILSGLFDGLWGYLNFVDRAQTYLPIAAMFIAATLGLADDLLGVLKIGPHGGGLRISQKLVVYIFLALLGALWFYYRLDWDVLLVPFIGNVQIGWLYIPLFMFIIVASAFSANETDGLDGLLGGVMLFAFIALTTVAFVLGRYHLAAFGGVTIGALLAFLWFNIYPARFFMGDTGSMSLGITMGIIAMLTNTTLLLPFFASILVIVSLSVIIQVISKRFFGRKVFLVAPIHHHFEALGWPETKVTMRFWIISAIFCVLGLVIFFLNRFLI
ncbi:MAG: phospho-N-acetylmuramoyl-pentapeptide-transferase [Candidatus Harrisonbacteria bacterium RIFCSPHIGHO2_01_FULL_44_13]|uniref:Phospho-N-acetylmuramoyl-pentapeptide-transferase n=1 Tax=Candidatus Harrisonbacteria bacterium RIFCSPLOWO2_01_FULL_44_18 TaxID=1798407 RepID=A0A1G1ZPB7_9BACT|nr:MAG: phospho-N-acetylmuramoyl-pentapeptide-transferase [Candidatus Harrisonbacteria bacterium RIFCSPHIGHO2_01_FULL_44_13]OGY66006.1 MAG: phospho-N-acetylmuramoyl-pentapeptide-transferase [Candidatus Harrisonbacteria bacterium RIFCSPLOWO2_01_FULL_44_18]